MSIYYSEADLISYLGEPAKRGNLPGSGSAGIMDAPWHQGPLKFLPLGANRYMAWDCLNDSLADEYCEAVSISKDNVREDLWLIVRLCSKHAGKLFLSPFPMLYPMPETIPKPIPEYDVVIVRHTDRDASIGEDFERLQRLKSFGYKVIFTYGDRKLPDMSVYLLKLE